MSGWARQVPGNPAVLRVDPGTWVVLFDEYVAEWLAYVFTERVDLQAARHTGKATVSGQVASVEHEAVADTRSLGLALLRYADEDGAGIRPSRPTLERHTGYRPKRGERVDPHIERLERAGWISCEGQDTGSGANVWALTVPAGLWDYVADRWRGDRQVLGSDVQQALQVLHGATTRQEVAL